MARRARWSLGAALLLAGCSATPVADTDGDATSLPPISAIAPPTEPGGAGRPPSAEEVEVIEVVDGDTLDVRFPDGRTDRVRLLGINAPEDGECFSTEATAALERLVAGQPATLVPDRSDRDRFGRLLRYVEVDGEDAGARLVADGFALVRVSSPDEAREPELRDREEEARSSRRGLWSPSACGEPGATVGPVAIVGLRLDAEGDDAQNLNDEWVEVRNEGAEPVDLSGWGLRDESSSHRFTFPRAFTLAPGATVRIRSGCGTGSATELFWCTSGSAIWNNDGDTAFLTDPAGNIVDRLAR